MKTNRLFSIVSTLVLGLSATVYQVQAQQPGSRSTSATKPAEAGGEIDLSTLLAQAGRNKPRGFSLMAESRNVAASGAVFSTTPMATGPGLPVTGGGTSGRLTKWTGFTSSNAAIGDSSIYEDKFGKVGIGTDSPTSRLTVAGTVEATGGFKFADGTVQATAGITPNQLVLVRDVDNPALQPVQANASCNSNSVDSCEVTIFTVPLGKRLVIEYVSMGATIPPSQGATLTIDTFAGGAEATHLFPLSPPAVPILGTTRTFLGQQVRIYADPGKTVLVQALRTSTAGNATFEFSISGYLVNLP